MFCCCFEALAELLLWLFREVGLEGKDEDGHDEEDADHEGGEAGEAQNTEGSR